MAAEQSEIIVKGNWLDEAKEARKHCLIGIIVLKKRINVKAIKNVMSTIWKLSARMSIKEVGEKVFIFHFEDVGEKKVVLLRQPWSFNKSLLVLENYDDHTNLKEINFNWCPFRVQVYGLLLGMMTKKIGLMLGESIGDVEEVDTDGEKLAWEKYLRVRVT